MKYNYDLICIGLGPAGMAVSVMAVEMGLKVCAIEKYKVGGECMNVGCIPSKSILAIAEMRHSLSKLKEMGLYDGDTAQVASPFSKIDSYLDFINSKKTMKMFDQVDLILNEGVAEFVDSHTVKVGDKTVTAKKIFIATGTEPMIPPIDGISEVEVLDNTNIFNLKETPESLTVVGGGAIGCELAQAFSRLGTKCSILHMDEHLIPMGSREAGETLQKVLEKEGIAVYHKKKVSKFRQDGKEIVLSTEDGLELRSEKLLMAAGRKIVLDDLHLEKAGVKFDARGIKVDSRQRTNKKHIYAAGDCTGGIMLSHAAMHQGMFAIMNAVSPFSFFKYTGYVVPWTVFTDPEVSYVGMSETELKAKKIKYETHVANYGDYGAAIAEHASEGFIRVFTSAMGRIYGVCIVGKGSGEMINEWALAIQNKIRMHQIMFLAHSFPTMGFLSKRVSEMWMMKKMGNRKLQKMIGFMYRRM